jgi:hypothetical protein
MRSDQRDDFAELLERAREKVTKRPLADGGSIIDHADDGVSVMSRRLDLLDQLSRQRTGPHDQQALAEGAASDDGVRDGPQRHHKTEADQPIPDEVTLDHHPRGKQNVEAREQDQRESE